jgi:hypothetical protein
MSAEQTDQGTHVASLLRARSSVSSWLGQSGFHGSVPGSSSGMDPQLLVDELMTLLLPRDVGTVSVSGRQSATAEAPSALLQIRSAPQRRTDAAGESLSSASRGSATTTCVSPPSLSAESVPPWACTMWCTMCSPRPKPSLGLLAPRER